MPPFGPSRHENPRLVSFPFKGIADMAGAVAFDPERTWRGFHRLSRAGSWSRRACNVGPRGLFVTKERDTQPFQGAPEATAQFRLVRASGVGRRRNAISPNSPVGRRKSPQ
jgi:hypothetical protein